MTTKLLACRLVLVAAALLLIFEAPAGANAFLVSTTPGQGERLSGSQLPTAA